MLQQICAGIAGAGLLATPALPAEVSGNVIWLEAAPTETDAAAAGLAAAASRQRDSHAHALQEVARPERLAWIAEQAPPAVLPALQSMLLAPADVRATRRLLGSTTAASAQSQPLWMLAHLDIAGPGGDQIPPALSQLAAAAARSSGNLGFELWQERQRGNHFYLVGVWRERRDYDAFVSGAEARAFRRAIANALGSPYDPVLMRELR